MTMCTDWNTNHHRPPQGAGWLRDCRACASTVQNTTHILHSDVKGAGTLGMTVRRRCDRDLAAPDCLSLDSTTRALRRSTNTPPSERVKEELPASPEQRRQFFASFAPRLYDEGRRPGWGARG